MRLIQLVGILALFILQPALASNGAILQLAEQLASIIGQQHGEHQRESFDCWFYCPASTAYSNDLLDNLLVSNELQGIPLIQVNSTVPRFPESIPHPRLVVALLDTFDEDLPMACLTNFFNRFEQNINYIVVFRWTTLSSFLQLARFMLMLHLFNTLYIPVYDHADTIELTSHDVLEDRIYTHSLHTHASSLFPDQFRNMQGLVVNFSAMHDPPDINFDTTPPSGINFLLASTIAEKLNVTLNPVQFFCKPSETFIQCLQRKIDTEPSCFHLERVDIAKMSNDFITALIPTSISIIVPSMGSWTVIEMLSKPFQASLVMCIILYCVAALLIMLFLPNLFQNNLILLPFFGFEKHNLHRTKWLERWTMLAVVVVTFVVRSAYECKMIAIFTNRPYRFAVTSLDELSRSDVKIQGLVTRLPKFVSNDPRLIGVLEYATEVSDDFDVKYGYLMDSRHMAILKNLVEALTLRGTYTCLLEVLFNRYANYYFGLRNLLRDKFEHLQRVIFDVGIYNRWLVQEEWDYLLTYRRTLLSFSQDSEKTLLLFEDLRPAYALLTMGYAVSFMTFCLEIVWHTVTLGIRRMVGKYRKNNGKIRAISRALRAHSFNGYNSQDLPQTKQRRKSI